MRKPSYLLLLFTLCAAGCGMDHAENKGTDNNYIRSPDEQVVNLVTGKGPLLPSSMKTRWVWDVSTKRRSIEDGMIKDESLRNETEEVVVTGNAKEGTIFSILKNGKPFREEIFDINDTGIFQLAAGLNDKVTMSPALPLIKLPVKEGDGQSWTGVLKYQKITTAGTAYSRVSGQDKIKVPAGEFGAWRVETVIITTVGGQPVSFRMTRWFAPGVGVVRQLLYVGNILVEKELHTYSPNKA